MKWKKGKIESNDCKNIECWRSSCLTYLIHLNENIGKPEGKFKGHVDNDGHGWLLEIFKITNKQESLGTAPTLKSAKAVAECDEEGI